ncbi:MAG: C-type lectin domain-containing protein [Kofleriaceae bacterium]|nr:C-type lectin domain-containing protein [Kofleriaceae bacterium]
MRGLLLMTLVSACGFSVQPGQGPVNEDAKRDGSGGEGTPLSDGAVDAPIDAAIDAPIDARACPAAPPNCDLFTCPGSSHCYYVCGKGDTEPWADGRDACADDNLGCLATIDDAAENNCITQATTPVFPNIVWMGYVQSSSGAEPAGGWAWQCGSSSYTNWGGSEPNNSGGNEDCAALNTGGTWIDGGCNTSARWVCELP